MHRLTAETKLVALSALGGLTALGALVVSDVQIPLPANASEMSTSIKCPPQGSPKIDITLRSPVADAEKFVIKIKSENGQSAEKEVPATADEKNKGQIKAGVEFSKFDYDKGRKIERNIQLGETISASAYRISIVHGANNAQAVIATSLTEPVSVKASCQSGDKLR